MILSTKPRIGSAGGKTPILQRRWRYRPDIATGGAEREIDDMLPRS
jgi:hypothetical protein